MKKSDNKPQTTGVATDKKKVTNNVARDDGIEGPKTTTTKPIKVGVDPAETKKA